MIQTRRGFIAGLGACLITAPAIVRAGSLMPVKVMLDDGVYGLQVEFLKYVVATMKEANLPQVPWLDAMIQDDCRKHFEIEEFLR